MRLNIKAENLSYRFGATHEGAPAARMNAEQALRRSVLSCLLWEREAYEDGQEIGKRIVDLAAQVPAETVAALAVEARHVAHLRHVPLLLLTSLIAKGGPLVAPTIEKVISRADELAELLAVYWRDGKRPLSKQMKVGLGRAFLKFDEYGLAKYNRDSVVKLRDVLFLAHPKPDTSERQAIWDRLAKGELVTPDTWEVELSAGKDKRETFERLIRERKLGYLALLRNLRNMVEAGCDLDLVKEAIIARRGGADRVLPFRYIAAARAAPQLEPAIDTALCEEIATAPALKGRTVVLVDVSGSMSKRLSAKSDLTRLDAACALASIIHAEHLRVFSFSSRLTRAWSHFGGALPKHTMNVVEVPPRRGVAGVDAIIRSQEHTGTLLFSSVKHINDTAPYDRLIVITDEQAFGAGVFRGGDPVASLPSPKGRGYMINVASARNGVGYGPWVHIDGFSESVLRFISEYENVA